MIIDSHCHLTYEPMSNALNDTINVSDKDILIENIRKDNILDCNLELKKIDILFEKIENDN